MLGLPDLHPDRLITDPDKDPSIIKQKLVIKPLISTVFLWLFYDFLFLKKDVNVSVFRIRIRTLCFWASRSVTKCHGSTTLCKNKHVSGSGRPKPYGSKCKFWKLSIHVIRYVFPLVTILSSLSMAVFRAFFLFVIWSTHYTWKCHKCQSAAIFSFQF